LFCLILPSRPPAYLSNAAQAAPVSLGSITTGDGLTFSLSVESGVASDLHGDGAGDNYLFTLTPDSTNYSGDGGDGAWISSVSPNVYFHDAQAIVSSPTGWVDGYWDYGYGHDRYRYRRLDCRHGHRQRGA